MISVPRVGFIALLTCFGLFTAMVGASEAAKPGSGVAKPLAPGAAGAIQVGVHSVLNGISGVDRVEMQLKHENSWSAPETPNATYTFSFVAKTDNGWLLRMGELVSQADWSNQKRFFIQVFKPNGSGGYDEHYWNLSRAGAGNTPPASSCSSGDDTCSGYPYSVVLAGGTATFYFDWISKGRVRVNGASYLTEVYFLGELAGGTHGDTLGPRTALTTYRVWNGGPSWLEPASADAFYSGASCSAYGVEYLGRSATARADGVQYRSVEAGSGQPCITGLLW